MRKNTAGTRLTGDEREELKQLRNRAIACSINGKGNFKKSESVTCAEGNRGEVPRSSRWQMPAELSE